MSQSRGMLNKCKTKTNTPPPKKKQTNKQANLTVVKYNEIMLQTIRLKIALSFNPYFRHGGVTVLQLSIQIK